MINTKKFIFAFFLIFVFVSAVSAEGVKIGILVSSAVDEAEFNESVKNTWRWYSLREDHSNDDRFIFHENLNAMQIALRAGKIKEIDVPEIVGEYMIKVNPDYEISCVMRCYYDLELVFGFLRNERGFELQEKFNDAIAFLKMNGKLDEIIENYTNKSDFTSLKPVEFENFDGAETIKIAITGDIPPIDFISAEGEAAGFNTAILYEIAKRLKINVEIVDIETAARTASLTSGRADVVFWYMKDNGPTQFDIHEEIITSDPYYSWNTFVHLRLKK